MPEDEDKITRTDSAELVGLAHSVQAHAQIIIVETGRISPDRNGVRNAILMIGNHLDYMKSVLNMD